MGVTLAKITQLKLLPYFMVNSLRHSGMNTPSEVRTIFLALSARADLIGHPLSAFDVLPAVYRLILSMGYQNPVRFVSVVYKFRF